MGWFDDFSQTSPGYDALGALARGQITFAENLPLPTLGPVRQGQYKRCPGGAEAPAADGSNVLSAEEQRGARSARSPTARWGRAMRRLVAMPPQSRQPARRRSP